MSDWLDADQASLISLTFHESARFSIKSMEGVDVIVEQSAGTNLVGSPRNWKKTRSFSRVRGPFSRSPHWSVSVKTSSKYIDMSAHDARMSASRSTQPYLY